MAEVCWISYVYAYFLFVRNPGFFLASENSSRNLSIQISESGLVSIQFQLCHAFWQKITYQCKTDKGISYFLNVGLIKGMYDTQNFHCFLSFLRKYCPTPSEMLRAMYSLLKRRNPKPIQSGAAIAPTTDTNFCTSLQNCSGASALDAPPLRRSYWRNTGHSPLRKL